MARSLQITADDFGLTRLVTDRILETADCGALTAVSLIANGDETEYALEAYLKRRERLKLSVHCNLTEGPALSPKEQVPHLVDRNGNLRHSFFSLLLRSLFAVSSTRKELKSEIKKELSAQIALVRDAIGEGELRIDGHQHVHMLPFVFDVLCEIAPAYGVSSVRIPKEPFYFATPLRFSNIAKHFLLNALARGNRKKARAAGLAANDRFLGALYSGVMSLASFERGLSCIRAHTPNASVEALFHPGNPNVLDTPRAQYPRSDLWYASTYRLQEYQALMDPRLKAIVHQFEQGEREQAPHTWRDFWNGEHRIYVSEKQKRVHYDAIARDVLSLLPAGTHTILDYGCGDALSTETFVSTDLTVVLCDPIPAVTQSLHKRFDGVSGVRIVGDLEELSPASVDVILINSVLQYLSKEEFVALLPVCKKVLRPGGVLLIGDVVPKGSHLFADVRSLLVSAYRYQFLAAAFWGLFETFFSGYRALRRAQGFSTYSDTEFIALLREAHFSGKRAERNIGLTPHRMTFVAK